METALIHGCYGGPILRADITGNFTALRGSKLRADYESPKADRFPRHAGRRVRLWDQNDLIEQLLALYDKLDDDIRAELPLKQIWIVATQGDEN